MLKPHRQLTQATVHHALNFNLPKDNETNPAMQGNATVGSAELKTISNVLAPPGGFARLGTMSTVTTCDEYLQPFVVLAIMVLILRRFSI